MLKTQSLAWPPRYLTDTSAYSRGEEACDFIETFCRITEDSIGGPAGQLIELRDWQRNLIYSLLAEREDGRLQHRQALIGLPRKNGKSALGAALALWALVTGPPGSQVFSCAGDEEQARIVFGTAKRMVEMDPSLSDAIHIRRDSLEYQSTGSIYRVLSAEAYTKEGLSPTFVIFDEVHVQPTRELWDVMANGQGARKEPLMVGITTAGVKTDTTGEDSICYQLYQYGQRLTTGEIDDPSFFFAWYEAPPDADHTDPAIWEVANPGFGDILSDEDLASQVLRTHENEFRTKRLNQWVNNATAWLPAGAWDETRDANRVIADRTPVVLGFDGSRSGDSTALVVITCEAIPHLDVVAVWERPQSAYEWVVDHQEVLEAIRAACLRWRVQELTADPAYWQNDLEILQKERITVGEFPQRANRMNLATQRFYEAVTTKQLTHSANPALARHVANATLKRDQYGSRLSKSSQARKIDLAVASVMALERAAFYTQRLAPPSKAWKAFLPK
jgi:phage terminase large subunit-like protein